MLALIFLIAALVVFIIAAFGIAVGRYSLIALGLALLTASMLAGHVIAGK